MVSSGIRLRLANSSNTNMIDRARDAHGGRARGLNGLLSLPRLNLLEGRQLSSPGSSSCLLRPNPLPASVGRVSLPAGFLPPGLSHPVDPSLRGWSSWPWAPAAAEEAPVCVQPTGQPSFLSGSRPPWVATASSPGLNLVPSSGMWDCWHGAPTH